MAEQEKITINLGVVDLGQIDLLVDEGFYSSRTDFIRSAIRAQLEAYKADIRQTMTRRAFGIGILNYSRKDLEDRRATGTNLDVKIIGMLYIDEDVTPELARATIASIQVFGVLKASPEVRAALVDRIK
jgi:Arc/MetJ-type ribon-helix-helix transcriptional regulator